MRKSGLQTDVLTLYRNLLKAARLKEVPGSKTLREFVRFKFRERALSIGRNDFQTIEHELRYGYKQIKLIKMPGFSAASITK